MNAAQALIYETRGEFLDLTHFGHICAVDEDGKLLFSVGNPNAPVYFRSTSKPAQALPTILRGLDKKYGLTEEETAIFCGSHAGELRHVAVLESIFDKCGFHEEQLVMKPAVPAYSPANKERILQGLPPRKFYHNCAGKHASLMLLQRELTGTVDGYWQMGSAADMTVRKVVEMMSECAIQAVGVDGCGVPVYAVPIRNIAVLAKNLSCPDRISDPIYCEPAQHLTHCMNLFPQMIRGSGYLCEILNSDPNIFAKGGAASVYGFGLKQQRIGFSFKFIDGTEHNWGIIATVLLKKYDALKPEIAEKLATISPTQLRNDNGTVVGTRTIAFDCVP